MHQILFWLGLRPRPTGGNYSAHPEPIAGGGQPTSNGNERGKGKGGERIEEVKRRKGRGRNVAFHHLINFEILFCHSVYNILISIEMAFGLLDYGLSGHSLSVF